jgi:hypothetical protein
MSVALPLEARGVAAAPNRRATDAPDEGVRIVSNQLVLAERRIDFRQIEAFVSDHRPAQYRNEPSNILWWSGAAVLVYALFEFNDLATAKLMGLVAIAAVALAGHYAGRVFSPPPVLVSPQRWSVDVELTDGNSLPLFTTTDGDFAERAAKRLDALLTLGDAIPDLIINPRDQSIRVLQPRAPHVGAVAAAAPATADITGPTLPVPAADRDCPMH